MTKRPYTRCVSRIVYSYINTHPHITAAELIVYLHELNPLDIIKALTDLCKAAKVQIDTVQSDMVQLERGYYCPPRYLVRC